MMQITSTERRIAQLEAIIVRVHHLLQQHYIDATKELLDYEDQCTDVWYKVNADDATSPELIRKRVILENILTNVHTLLKMKHHDVALSVLYGAIEELIVTYTIPE